MKLLIGQQRMIIVDKVYDIILFQPVEEKFGMKSQIIRNATAIPSNIAEESAMSKWEREKMIAALLDMIITEQKMLAKFIDKVGGHMKAA